MIKIGLFVILGVGLWLIVTHPDTAAPAVAELLKSTAGWLQVILGATLKLLEEVIRLFQIH